MANSNRNNLGAAFARTAGCLAIEELAMALEGRRGDEFQRRAEAHVAGCPHCRTELALLREFEAPTLNPEERRGVNWIVARLRKNSPAARVPWWKRISSIGILVPASVALAAALIVIGIGIQSRRTSTEPSIAPGAEVMRSQAIDLIAPLGDITSRPTELKWKPVNGASRYRVRVLEVDRTELWNITTADSSVALNGAVRKQIVPLKTLTWEVSALDRAGSVIANSGIQAFRLEQNAAR